MSKLKVRYKESGLDAAGFLSTTYHSGAAAVQATHGLCLVMLVKTHEMMTSSWAPFFPETQGLYFIMVALLSI